MQARTAPIIITYVGIPNFVMNVAAAIEVNVIAKMRGSIRIPDEIGLAPRMDWKYRGRRYMWRMKAPPILTMSDELVEVVQEVPNDSDGDVSSFQDTKWVGCPFLHQPLINNERRDQEDKADNTANDGRAVPRLLHTVPLKNKENAQSSRDQQCDSERIQLKHNLFPRHSCTRVILGWLHGQEKEKRDRSTEGQIDVETPSPR